MLSRGGGGGGSIHVSILFCTPTIHVDLSSLEKGCGHMVNKYVSFHVRDPKQVSLCDMCYVKTSIP